MKRKKSCGSSHRNKRKIPLEFFFSLCERKKVLMKKNNLLISSHDNKDKAVCGHGKKKSFHRKNKYFTQFLKHK